MNTITQTRFGGSVGRGAVCVCSIFSRRLFHHQPLFYFGTRSTRILTPYVSRKAQHHFSRTERTDQARFIVRRVMRTKKAHNYIAWPLTNNVYFPIQMPLSRRDEPKQESGGIRNKHHRILSITPRHYFLLELLAFAMSFYRVLLWHRWLLNGRCRVFRRRRLRSG